MYETSYADRVEVVVDLQNGVGRVISLEDRPLPADDADSVFFRAVHLCRQDKLNFRP